MAKHLVWIRKELRLEDNTALIAGVEEAFSKGESLRLVFHLNPRQFKKGAPSHEYFFSAVEEFWRSCRQRNIPITFLEGELPDCFSTLLKEDSEIRRVHINAAERGYGRIRDGEMTSYLEARNIQLVSYLDHHLHGAEEIKNTAEDFYKVFTPYYNQWRNRAKPRVQALDYDKLYAVLAKNQSPAEWEKQEQILTKVKNGSFISKLPAGEQSAIERLESFCLEELPDYDKNRDYPAKDGTSRLSFYLSTGQLSIRQVYCRANQAGNGVGVATFLKELAWRDFYNMIYHFYPRQKQEEIIAKYRGMVWAKDEQAFQRWKEGQTGFPLIDAAMRQLKAEGWMHNRLRMLTACFLTKDLLIDWRWGEEYFSQALIDYDSASNIGGWQWSASVGTDACPYFRVFNPFSQSRKFDKEGDFIRRYIPELSEVPSKYIHEPYLMSKEEQQSCKVEIGKDYPLPMVNHQEQRLKAIEMFRR